MREWIESTKTRLFEKKFGNEQYSLGNRWESMRHWFLIKKPFRNIRLGDI